MSERIGRKWPPAKGLLWLMTALFIITFAAQGLARHTAFQSNGYDLGNVDQALWNTARGRILAFTDMAPVQNRLALHVEPILFLFVPFYWLGLGSPQLLIILQAISLGLGAIPLYYFARLRLRNYIGGDWQKYLCLIPAAAYLLFPALEAAALADFHAVALAPLFSLSAFYWAESLAAEPSSRKTRRALLLSLILWAACKEEMALAAAGFGLYLALRPGFRRWGAAVAAGGIAWFVIALFVIQPYFSPSGGNIHGERYTWLITALQRGQWDVILTHLQQVRIGLYLLGLLIPAAGLSLLAPAAWLPALPSLAVNLLSNDPFSWRLEEFHYAAPLAGIAMAAAVIGLGRLLRLCRRWTPIGPGERPHADLSAYLAGGILLAAAVVYHLLRGWSPLSAGYISYDIGPHQRLGAAMLDSIPAEAPLFAQVNLNPHASARRWLYQDFNQIDGLAGFPPAEYLWLDAASLPNDNNIQAVIKDDLLARYHLLQAADGYLLLKRGQPLVAAMPPSFFNFIHYFAPPAYKTQVDFGGRLRLTGFEPLFRREEEIRISMNWLALENAPADLHIFLYLLDKEGTPLGATTVEPAALVWHPLREWQQGEAGRLLFDTLPWYTRDMAEYRLAVAVSTSSDPWDAGGRLPPQIRQADFSPRLAGEGTMLELGRFDKWGGMPRGGPLPVTTTMPSTRYAPMLQFQNGLLLRGYEQRMEDSRRLDLTFYWSVDRPETGPLKRFAHVLDDHGGIVAQMDSSADNGAAPVSLWRKGEIIEDTLTLALPEGIKAQTVVVGWYNPDNGGRVMLAAPYHNLNDSVELPGPDR